MMDGSKAAVMRVFLGSILCVVVPSGCGEVVELELNTRPSTAQFPAVQETLTVLGCAEARCHLNLNGDFQVSALPKGPAALEEEYLLTKAFVNLESPDESLLLRVSLKGDPATLTHPYLCFENKNACGYKKLLAWITAEDEDAPNIDDVDCDPVPGACSLVN